MMRTRSKIARLAGWIVLISGVLFLLVQYTTLVIDCNPLIAVGSYAWLGCWFAVLTLTLSRAKWILRILSFIALLSALVSLANNLSLISRLGAYPDGVEHFNVQTQDGITLRGVRFPRGHSDVVIIAHGSSSRKEHTSIVQMAEALASDFDVIVFDFRGHGGSGGRASFGQDEVLDLDSIIRQAQQWRYRRISVVGDSMGGVVAIAEASRCRCISALVTVGSPTRLEAVSNNGLSFLRFFSHNRLTRALYRLLFHVRLGPLKPLSVLDDIQDTCLPPHLIIHGSQDPWVPVEEADIWYMIPCGPKRRVVLPGGGHSISSLERQFPDTLNAEIVRWLEP